LRRTLWLELGTGLPAVAHPRALLTSLYEAAVRRASPPLVLPSFLPEPPRGRTVVTGPTYTNVNDFRAILIAA
jgi:hydroxypyruvate reductase